MDHSSIFYNIWWWITEHWILVLPIGLAVIFFCVKIIIKVKFQRENIAINLRPHRQQCLESLKELKNKIKFPSGQWVDHFIPKFNDEWNIRPVAFSKNSRGYNDIRKILREGRRLSGYRVRKKIDGIEDKLKKLCEITSNLAYTEVIASNASGIRNKHKILKDTRDVAFEDEAVKKLDEEIERLLSDIIDKNTSSWGF